MKTAFYALCLLLSRLFSRREGVIALMYHSIGENSSRLTVSPKDFRRQMEFLKSQKNPISMGEFLLWRKGECELPERAVLVTIDDGYRDTYEHAFPILKGLAIPFTLFLTSDLSEMSVLGNFPRPTWDQLREMVGSGLMEVGLHGHTHAKIGALAGNTDALDRELKDSIGIIERELAARPRTYAYAFGARHDAVPGYLEGLGIAECFGISDGIIAKDSPGRALRRVQIDRTMSFSLFRLRTTSAVDVAFRIKKFLGR